MATLLVTGLLLSLMVVALEGYEGQLWIGTGNQAACL